MAMKHQHRRLVHQGMIGSQHSIERVEVAAAGQRGAGVERLVESAQPDHHLAPKRHVASGAEDAGSRRVEGVAWLRWAGVAELAEPAAKSAAALEQDLRV